MSTKQTGIAKIESHSTPAPATDTETIYTAKRTLKAWLTVLEDGGLLKPGATARILMHRKLKRCVVPAVRS